MALGSKAEYGSFSGAAIDVADQVRQQRLSTAARPSTPSSARSPATSPPPERTSGRPSSTWARATCSRARSRRTGRPRGTVGGPIVKDKLWFFGAFDYLRGASLPPLWSLNSESWGRYADLKLSAAPFTNHRAFVAYHYENNDGNGWSWGNQPGWDTSMTLRLQDEEQHRLGPVAVVPRATRRRSPPSAWASGPTTRPTFPSDAPGHPGLHQLVEVDRRLRQLRHQRRLPLRRGLAVEPQDHPGRLLALRRGLPGRARPQVRRPVHEGTQQLPGRLLPELRQLPVPVPLDPERPVHAVLVRRHRAHLLQPEGHDQPYSDRAHRRLPRRFLRRPVVAHQAPDDQSRAPLRPHDHQVRSREGLRLRGLSRGLRQPHRPARPRLRPTTSSTSRPGRRASASPTSSRRTARPSRARPGAATTSRSTPSRCAGSAPTCPP